MLALVQSLTAIVALALAVSAVSVTVAKTKITMPLRKWVKGKSAWLHSLVSCPYCLSHWLSFAAVLIYRPTLVHFFAPLDWLVSAFVIVALAAFSTGLIIRALLDPMQPVPATFTDEEAIARVREIRDKMKANGS